MSPAPKMNITEPVYVCGTEEHRQALEARSVWTNRGRALSAVVLLVGAVVDMMYVRGNTGYNPARAGVTVREVLTVAMLSSLYGSSVKLLDLTEEHGLRGAAWKWGGSLVLLCSLFTMMWWEAGASLFVSDIAYHGIIKGKVDTKGHFAVTVLLLPLMMAGMILSGAHVDWVMVFFVQVSSTAWMWLNNKLLVLHDNMFHIMRGDVFLPLLAVSAVQIEVLPFAVAVACEHLSYGGTKLVGMQCAWYTDGAENVPEDQDPIGLAFHRRDYDTDGKLAQSGYGTKSSAAVLTAYFSLALGGLMLSWY